MFILELTFSIGQLNSQEYESTCNHVQPPELGGKEEEIGELVLVREVVLQISVNLKNKLHNFKFWASTNHKAMKFSSNFNVGNSSQNQQILV